MCYNVLRLRRCDEHARDVKWIFFWVTLQLAQPLGHTGPTQTLKIGEALRLCGSAVRFLGEWAGKRHADSLILFETASQESRTI